MKKINFNQIKRFLFNNDFYKLNFYIKKLPKASFLFVTYNRCSNKEANKNPLVWSFQTLINNKFNNINDYVVVDDCSNDHTYESVKWLEKTYKIKIKYIRNKRHKEYSYNRKIGIRYTKNNLVFMGDDDCLFSEYFVIGSLLTYYFLKQIYKIKNLAVINFSVYEKTLFPKFLEQKNKIGKVFLKKTFFYHNFDKFPEGCLTKPVFLDKNNIILKPFKVDTFSGVNLCDKRLIFKAGNYFDLSMWKNGYSEHIELSHRLKEKNFVIYHQPDPKISCLHLKYGINSRDKFDNKYFNVKLKGLKYRLGDMIKMSQIKNFSTGSRTDDITFHIIEIGTLFSFYLKISKKLGIKFAKKEYNNFVEKGLVFSTTPSGRIKSKKERQKIWVTAIKKGCIISQRQTKINYMDVYKLLTKELNIC